MSHSETLRLVVPYERAAIPIIASFSHQAARFLGATPEEAGKFELACEEAALFIITNVPPTHVQGERFEISCHTKDRRMEMHMKDKGLPKDPSRLPQYTHESPASTADGLGLFLIQQMVDDFVFQNHGQKGWEIVLYKDLAMEAKDPLPDRSSFEGQVISENETVEYTVRRMKPQEAHGLSRLTYLTYGYSYSKEAFYFPDQLAEMIAREQVIAFVALLPNGEIIGQMGLLPIPDTGGLAEAGLGMVDPAFRRSNCLLRMAQEAWEYSMGQDFTGFFSGFVTKHIYSQKSGSLFGMKPVALRLSLHPRADFKELGDKRLDRESLLDGFLPLKLPDFVPAHCPPAHEDMIGKIFENMGMTIRPVEAPHLPTGPKGEIRVLEKPDMGLALIKAKTLGPGLARKIREEKARLCLHRFDTLYVSLDLGAPDTARVSEELEQAGFFFTGVEPVRMDRWNLMMTFLNNQVMDYKAMQLYDPFAQKLLEYVQKRHAQATRRLV